MLLLPRFRTAAQSFAALSLGCNFARNFAVLHFAHQLLQRSSSARPISCEAPVRFMESKILPYFTICITITEPNPLVNTIDGRGDEGSTG